MLWVDPLGLSDWEWWDSWVDYTGIGTIMHVGYDKGWEIASWVHSGLKLGEMANDPNLKKAKDDEVNDTGDPMGGKTPKHGWGNVLKKLADDALPEAANAAVNTPNTMNTGPVTPVTSMSDVVVDGANKLLTGVMKPKKAGKKRAGNTEKPGYSATE